jgi:Flp pilus assembly pilin Flp
VQTTLLKLHLKLQDLASRVEGQDMVEYALVLGLLSFGITAASQFLANSLASAFEGLSSTLGGYIS